MIGTTYQVVVLLLFNDFRMLSYQEVKSQFNLKDEDVTILLHSVACGKYNTLLKTKVNKTIITSDNFKFNHTFTHKFAKNNIPLLQVDEKRMSLKLLVKKVTIR